MKLPSILSGSAVFAALCLATPAAAAQQVTNEAELWLELGLRYEPVRRLRLSLDQHLRIDEDISRPQAMMSELAVRYAPLRWLRVAVGYRVAAELDNDEQGRRRHRFHVDVSTRHRLRPVALAFRLRFAEEARAADDNGEPWRHTLRFRAGLEVRRIPLVEPQLSVEIFVRLADGAALTVRKLRGTVGVGINTDSGAVSVGYRVEGHLIDNAVAHIFLLAWHFDLDL